jgi:hypothetical protein
LAGWTLGASLVPRKGCLACLALLAGFSIDNPYRPVRILTTARDRAVCRRDGGQGNGPSRHHQQAGQNECSSLHWNSLLGFESPSNSRAMIVVRLVMLVT